MNRLTERFITPGVALACIAATAAAVIKVVAAGRVSASWLALILVLAGVYALLATVGLWVVEQLGTRAQLRFVLASMFVMGAGAMAASRGDAVLLIVPTECSTFRLWASPPSLPGARRSWSPSGLPRPIRWPSSSASSPSGAQR